MAIATRLGRKVNRHENRDPGIGGATRDRSDRPGCNRRRPARRAGDIDAARLIEQLAAIGISLDPHHEELEPGWGGP
jgi:hypothetical protein